MEDLILKCTEFGALGIVTIYLLTKGTDALKDLAQSNKSLADSVKALADKVNLLDNRVDDFKQQLRDIGHRLNKIESQFAELRRFIEKSTAEK